MTGLLFVNEVLFFRCCLDRSLLFSCGFVSLKEKLQSEIIRNTKINKVIFFKHDDNIRRLRLLVKDSIDFLIIEGSSNNIIVND